MKKMFEKVLVPTDFSPYADAVIRCIRSMPELQDVVLLHVLPPGPQEGSSVDAVRMQLAEEEERLRAAGFFVIARLEEAVRGDVADTILHIADAERVSLIVIGAKGRGVIERILLGSVSSAVLREARTSVLIMRHRVLESREGPRYEKFCPRLFSRILVPIDFSEPSIAALSLLPLLAGVGEVVLVHVVSRGEAPAVTPEILQAYAEDAEEKLGKLRDDLVQQGFSVQTRVRMGLPTHEIDRIAEAEDVSLILMSSRGRGRAREFLLGSTAFNIVETVKRPVLVVKTAP